MTTQIKNTVLKAARVRVPRGLLAMTVDFNGVSVGVYNDGDIERLTARAAAGKPAPAATDARICPRSLTREPSRDTKSHERATYVRKGHTYLVERERDAAPDAVWTPVGRLGADGKIAIKASELGQAVIAMLLCALASLALLMLVWGHIGGMLA